MSLESFNFIDSLNASNPTTTDNVSEGDDHIRGIKSTLKTTFPSINAAITATDEEINLLDGVTATTAELNTLDGITATTAELNVVDGITATVAELNILDGVTSTAAELNVLDGITSTVTELNYTDGVTSAIQTQLGTKLPLAGGTMTGTIAGFTSTGIDDNANSTAITIDASENVGIGTSSPSEKLVVNGKIHTGYTGTIAMSLGTDYYKGMTGTHLTSGTARGLHIFQHDIDSDGGTNFWRGRPGVAGAAISMKIDSGGKVLVGKTSTNVLSSGAELSPSWLSVTADTPLVYLHRPTADGDMIRFFRASSHIGGISVTASSTAYNTSSDYRLKENVVPMTGSIDRLKALKPSKFNFKADSDTTVDGFLAHEAGEVVPECMSGTKDAMVDEEYEVTPAVMDGDTVVTEAVMGTRSVPDYQGIDQSKLVPLLVASLQEAIARIEVLENA